MTSQWDFVIAAYAVTALGTAAVLLHSWMRMRRAEQQADGLRQGGDTPAPPAPSVSPE